MNVGSMMLSDGDALLVAIPCLNEADTIAQVVAAVPREMAGVSRVDVLVVDDGSADATADLARAAGAIVLRHRRNRGVGAAFQSAIEFAIAKNYGIMVNIDGDGQFDPADIPKLVAPIVADAAEMVTASRFIDADLVPATMPRVKRVGNRMMSYLISKLVRRRFADVSCGFRCYGRRALLSLNLHGAFTYTQETFLDFAAKGVEILEVPIHVQYFEGRQSRVAGSIRKYAINALKIILRGYRDYFPLRFFWGIALAFGVPGVLLGILFFGHFLVTGRFAGYLYAGFSSAFLLAMSTLFVIVGVVADMLDRIRANQERVLLMLKRESVDRTGTAR